VFPLYRRPQPTECRSVAQGLPFDTDETLREAQFLLGELTDPEEEASIRLRAERCGDAISELRGALARTKATEQESVADELRSLVADLRGEGDCWSADRVEQTIARLRNTEEKSKDV